MQRCVLWALALVVGSAGLAAGQTKTLEVTVAAGPHDRVNVPVRVFLDLPGEFGTTALNLKDAAGGAVPAQLTAPGLANRVQKPSGNSAYRELHFVVPQLKSGETTTFKATLTAGPASPAGKDGFTWQDTPGKHSDLLLGGRPALRYMYEKLDESAKERRDQTFKVFHHLFDPSGQRLVTKGPGGLYTHHRGLFFGFNNISYGPHKKVDTWHCPGNVHQAHERIAAQEAGPVLGRHQVEIGWRGPDKEIFAVEERELTVYNVPGGRLVEFATRLTSRVGKVKLDGDPQHAGFHFRADNEVADMTKKQTYFLRPDGPGKPGETRNWEPKTKKGPVNLPWNTMSFVLGGQRYTVAYLDKPTNPKEARFSERDYGRFGSYFEYELDAGKPLELNYRVWLQTGEMKGPDVAAHSAHFVTPPAVTVK